ncbi:MAG: acyl-CoA dehydrogenase family protein [Janthinobacterium lividum]
MIDFELSPADQALVNEAHAQAELVRKYARHYEKNENEIPPREFPEAKDRPDPFAQRLDRAGEISGKAMVETLLHLELFWGDPMPLRVPNLSLGNHVLTAAGTPEQIAKWGGGRISIAITEPGAGSDPANIRTTAVFDAATDEWVINGEKIFITYAGDADSVMIFAKIKVDAEKWLFGTFVIEKGRPGFSVGPQLKKMGLRAEDTAGLVFENVRIPKINHVDGDFKSIFAVFNFSRPIVAACGLGTSRAMLDVVREKLAEQGVQVDYRAGLSGQSAIADRLLKLEAEYEATWLSVMRAKWLEDEHQAVKVEASMAKAMGGQCSRRISQEALELLGPCALTDELPLEKRFRDARIFDIYEGPGEVQRLLIARYLLNYTQKDLR